MSRTVKDRNKRKYQLGEKWLDYNFSNKATRRKIENVDISDGSAFKKYNRKLDCYGGM